MTVSRSPLLPRVLALALAAVPGVARAQDAAPWSVPVRVAAPSDGAWREQAAGLLAVALRVRTSVAADRAAPAAMTPEDMFATPFLVWSGRDAVALTPAARVALGEFLARGGLLLVDGDPARDAAFLQSAEDAVAAALPGSPLAPMAPDDLLARTFYLLPGRGVRAPGDVRVARVGRQVAVVLSHADALGALAGPADAARERATRFLVNVAMYALCLDYKDDQVHAPFLMRRRRSAP